MRLVVLDSGPVGLISKPPSNLLASRCRAWADGLLAAGVGVIVPEVADYEVRRELIRLGLAESIGRLDRLKSRFRFDRITSEVMRPAARNWAEARARGRPTASPDSLDADCILAAQAFLAAGPGDEVTVATGNVGHLGQFVDARPWPEILA